MKTLAPLLAAALAVAAAAAAPASAAKSAHPSALDSLLGLPLPAAQMAPVGHRVSGWNAAGLDPDRRECGAPTLQCESCRGAQRACLVIDDEGRPINRYYLDCASEDAPVPPVRSAGGRCSPQVQCGECRGWSRTCTIVGCDGSLRTYPKYCDATAPAAQPLPDNALRRVCTPLIDCGDCNGSARSCLVVDCEGRPASTFSLACGAGADARPNIAPGEGCSAQVQCGACLGNSRRCTAVGCGGRVRTFMENCE